MRELLRSARIELDSAAFFLIIEREMSYLRDAERCGEKMLRLCRRITAFEADG
jgi:hypothetical protein